MLPSLLPEPEPHPIYLYMHDSGHLRRVCVNSYSEWCEYNVRKLAVFLHRAWSDGKCTVSYLFTSYIILHSVRIWTINDILLLTILNSHGLWLVCFNVLSFSVELIFILTLVLMYCLFRFNHLFLWFWLIDSYSHLSWNPLKTTIVAHFSFMQ